MIKPLIPISPYLPQIFCCSLLSFRLAIHCHFLWCFVMSQAATKLCFCVAASPFSTTAAFLQGLLLFSKLFNPLCRDWLDWNCLLTLLVKSARSLLPQWKVGSFQVILQDATIFVLPCFLQFDALLFSIGDNYRLVFDSLEEWNKKIKLRKSFQLVRHKPEGMDKAQTIDFKGGKSSWEACQAEWKRKAQPWMVCPKSNAWSVDSILICRWKKRNGRSEKRRYPRQEQNIDLVA